MSGGVLANDPLFVGLTRPTMIFGVSIKYAMLNMLISLVAFIQTSGIYIIFVALVVHLIGYILCFTEPRFMELHLKRLEKCNDCSNRLHYGANSYMP